VANHFDAELLRKTRLELGLTQEDAATRLDVDVRTYRRYESGAVNDPSAGFSVRHPSRRRLLAAIERQFGLGVDELVREGPSPANVAPLRDWVPAVAHPLQRAPHFVGRAKLCAWLTDWRAEDAPQARVVALVGVGGAGKTALAERLLQSAQREPGPSGTFAWSFYEDPRVESFRDAALDYFAQAEARGARFEQLQRALSAGPNHLLVLDGLEVAQAEANAARSRGELEDPALRRLLRALASGLGAARALVTTRFELVDLTGWEGTGLRTVRLEPLGSADGQELLAAWGLAGDPQQLQRVCDGVGGHALSLAVIGSYVGNFLGGDVGRLEAVDLAEAARDDPLARRLGRVLTSYAEALEPTERDLLARLAVFPSGASIETLAALANSQASGALAGLAPEGIQQALARLERRGLVFGGKTGYQSHPFVRRTFRALLDVPAEQVHAVEQARLDEALAGRPDQPVSDKDLLDRYETLLRETLAAGLPDEAWGLYARSMGGFGHLGLRVGDMSRGLRVLRLFAGQGDPLSLPSELPPGVKAKLAYDWGLYAAALGEPTRALECYAAYDRYLDDVLDSPATSRAIGLRAQAYTLRLLGRLPEARAKIEASLQEAVRADSLFQDIRSRALQSVIDHDLGHVDQARRGFALARRLECREPIARRGLWEAEHQLDLGDLAVARELTQRNLAACHQLEWSGHTAHCHTVLGLAIAGDDPDAARVHLEEATRWTAVADEAEAQLREHELTARIALADHLPEQASRAAAAGLVLADSMHAGLFQIRLGVLAARAALAQSDPQEALRLARHALIQANADACGYAWGAADAAHVAGVAARAAGQDSAARDYLTEAISRREALKHPGLAKTRSLQS